MVLDFNFKFFASASNTYDNKILDFQVARKQEVEVTSFDDALAQLEAKIAELEMHGQELAQKKQINQQKLAELKVEYGVKELEDIAARINSLSIQLENEIHHFKEVAVEVNQYYHIAQETSHLNHINHKSTSNRLRPLNIWEIHFSSIPTIIRRGTRFIIIEKIINLFHSDSHNLNKYKYK